MRTMPWMWAMVAVGLLGCAPPPSVAPTDTAVETPVIELIYPPASAGSFALDADGHLRLLVVVDIDGFRFETPVFADHPEDMPADEDGVGHWHLNLNNAYVDAPEAAFYELDTDKVEAGDAVKLQVVLASKNHEELPEFQDVVEFDVTAPEKP